MKKKWTSGEVVHALRCAYGVAGSELVTDEWSLLTEVPLRSPRQVMGKQRDDSYWANTRTIDVLLVRNWSSGVGFRRIAVEVKVSRSDYRNETDVKRAPAEIAAHHTYYAAPAGIIDPLTLPHGWGLFEVYADAEEFRAGGGWVHSAQFGVRVRKRPVDRTPSCSMDYLVAATARQASRLAERMRRGEDGAAELARLRTEYDSVLGKLDRRDQTLARLRERLRDAQSQRLAVEGMNVCADCEHPIRYDERHRLWMHVDSTQNRPCEEIRREVNRLAREAATGSAYMRGWADPVEPKALREARLAHEGETL